MIDHARGQRRSGVASSGTRSNQRLGGPAIGRARGRQENEKSPRWRDTPTRIRTHDCLRRSITGGRGTMSKTVSAAAAGQLKAGGDININRLGFGAMRLTGPGIWGDPVDGRSARETLASLRE